MKVATWLPAEFDQKTKALPFIPLVWLFAVVLLAFTATAVVLGFEASPFSAEDLKWNEDGGPTVVNIKDTAARFLAAAFGLAQTVALAGAITAYLREMFRPQGDVGGCGSSLRSRLRLWWFGGPLLLMAIASVCIHIPSLDTARPFIPAKLLDAVRNRHPTPELLPYIVVVENILAMFVIFGSAMATGAVLSELDAPTSNPESPAKTNTSARRLPPPIGWLHTLLPQIAFSLLAALLDLDPAGGVKPSWANENAEEARKMRVSDLRSRIRRLRALLWWSSFALVSAVYQLYYEYRWPAVLMKGDSRDAAEATASAFAVSSGLFCSLCLLSVFFPAVQILRKRVDSVAVVACPYGSPADQEQWQRAEHISLSPRRLYIEITAVCSPLLAGLVATAFKS